MNLTKKLIAGICSVAMMSTMFLSLSTSAATDIPVLKPVLTETSEGVYDLAIQVNASECELGNRVYGLQCYIDIDYTKFDIATVKKEVLDEEQTDIMGEDVYVMPNVQYYTLGSTTYKPFVPIGWLSESNQITLVYTETNGIGCGSDVNLITFKNLALKDGVETTDVDITLSGVKMDIGKKVSGVVNKKSYVAPEAGVAAVAGQVNVGTATFPGNKTDDGGDDEPEITQGVVETEDANDEAVWAWTTAAATGNFLKVYADVTKVGETEATQVYNTFKIPANVEATNVKVGIVVQYNPTNIDEFVVTGMEIVSSAN